MLTLKANIKPMSRIILFCFIMLAAVTNRLQAQVQFTTNDWTTTLQTATKEHKNIFVDVYTSWCGPCKRMTKEVFSNKNVGNYMNEHFVCIKLDAEKQAEHPFFKQFKPTAYPTYYWLDANGRLLDSRSGYMPSTTFLQTVKEAIENNKGKQLEEYTQRWKAGERDTTFVETYLFEILPQFKPDSVRPYLNRFLSELPTEQRQSAAIGRMVMRFTRNLEDDLVLQTFLDNYMTYRKQMAPTDVDRAIYLILVRIPMMHFNTNKAQYASDLKILERLTYPDKELFNNVRNAEKLLFSANYTEGIRLASKLCQMNEKTHPSLYSELCYTLIISKFFSPDYTPSLEETKMVEQMALKAFKLSPSQNTLSYVAAAYARAGNYKKAYEALSYLPFYEAPTLSNAVYPLLGITFDRKKGK